MAVDIPDIQHVDGILTKQNARYEIQPQNLVATRAYTPIRGLQQPPLLDEQAHAPIEKCLEQVDRLVEAAQG